MPRLTGSFMRSGGNAAPGRRTLVVLVCVSIVLVTLYSREGSSGPVHVLRGAVQVAASPFSWLGSQVVRPVETLGTLVGDVTAGDETLSALQDKNAALTSQLAEFNEYKLENERLRQMLSLSSAYGAQGVAARVVGGSTSTWSDTITIDKGSSSGIAVDMPVTDGGGVVGQVTAVSAFSATVTLLSDPDYEVSALLQSSRSTGVLQGSVDGALHLAYVPADVSVSVGELVVTSGLGGAYPKGLLLGSVASVTSSPSDVYHTIVVSPVSRAANQEEVYVLTSFDAQTSEAAAETLLATGSFVAVATSDVSTAAQPDEAAPASDAASDGAEGEV